jgi:hypothetical protein
LAQINNVGMSYPSALYFHELDEHNPALIDNLIAINVNATTQVGAGLATCDPSGFFFFVVSCGLAGCLEYVSRGSLNWRRALLKARTCVAYGRLSPC